MPRRRRIALAGATFHVGSRGVAKQSIFRDDLDRQLFLRLLARVASSEGWRCLTYCLMGNHYHLIVRLRDANLSRGMQRLNGDYARAFNIRHGREDHLFGGRFWSEMITREAHLLELSRYVVLNPVRAGLCESAGEWAWSAHRALVGSSCAGPVDVAEMLDHFDGDRQRASRLYAEFVDRAGPATRLVEAPLIAALQDPDRDRGIARANLELGYSAQDIASVLGCSARTVRRRIALGVHKGV